MEACFGRGTKDTNVFSGGAVPRISILPVDFHGEVSHLRGEPCDLGAPFKDLEFVLLTRLHQGIPQECAKAVLTEPQLGVYGVV